LFYFAIRGALRPQTAEFRHNRRDVPPKTETPLAAAASFVVAFALVLKRLVISLRFLTILMRVS